MSGKQQRWFSARGVFHHQEPDTYEERVTLWLAVDADEAIAEAERDAAQYCEDLPGTEYLGLMQVYDIRDEPGHGIEVFSLMRDSALPPERYLDTYFDTGTERQSRDPVQT
ncbi:hypothetical protein [Streptomyces sp. CB00455]|uniref:hypothetical protein n=1 Tax=Streptomyces sp. CB00455 TaxID=1703927 RepID=UPI00093EB528|nr:hypothetical protein [Streptomyces sp. CB00455]